MSWLRREAPPGDAPGAWLISCGMGPCLGQLRIPGPSRMAKRGRPGGEEGFPFRRRLRLRAALRRPSQFGRELRATPSGGRAPGAPRRPAGCSHPETAPSSPLEARAWPRRHRAPSRRQSRWPVPAPRGPGGVSGVSGRGPRPSPIRTAAVVRPRARAHLQPSLFAPGISPPQSRGACEEEQRAPQV